MLSTQFNGFTFIILLGFIGGIVRSFAISGSSIISNGMCLDIVTSGVLELGNVQIWDCNDTPAQKWIYDSTSKAIKVAAYPQLCLEVHNGNLNNGENIKVWHCHNGANQKWIFDASTQTIKLDSNHGLCLDIFGGGDITNGENIIIFECHNGANQQFSSDIFSAAKSNGLFSIDTFDNDYNINGDISTYIMHIIGILILINCICITYYCYNKRQKINKIQYETVSIDSTDVDSI